MLTKAQKASLKRIAVWKPQSFSNGSSYRMQALPEGEHNGITITIKYNRGYGVKFPDGTETLVSFDRVSVGEGTDLDEHFCTRDQALEALR